MLHSLKRRLSKRKSTLKRPEIDIDSAVKHLATKAELNSFFDEEKIGENDRLGKCVMVFGPHEVVPTGPSLLFAYPIANFPYSKDKIEKITQFCYPGGMKNTKKQSPITDQFVFCMNDNGALLFGFVTHFFIEKPNFFSNIVTEEMFCICTVTDCPQVSANFSFQTALVSIIIDSVTDVKIPKNVPLHENEWKTTEHDIEVIKSFVPQLTIDKKYPQCAGINAFFIPEIFKQTADLYMRLSTKTSTSFELTSKTNIVIYPPEDMKRDIATVAFSYLFSMFSVQDVVRYIRSLLLEQRIIVIGSQLTTISFIVLASILLVSPLSSKCSMLPIIPDNPTYLDFLESPVPYVFGVLSSPNLENVSIDSDQTILFVDDHTVSYPDDIVHMPNAKQLRDTLSKILEDESSIVPKEKRKSFWEIRRVLGLPIMMSLIIHSNYFFIPDQTERIMSAIYSFVQNFVSKKKLNASRIRNTTDPNNPAVGFVKEAYLVDEPPENIEFLEQFLATQAFQAYFDETAFK